MCLKSNASYKSVKENNTSNYLDHGVIKDEIVHMGVMENGANLKTVELRKIAYCDDENKRCFKFITNLFGMNANHIALIYKER